MAIPAFLALPRENNALPKSAGKNASLKQKGNFEPSPHHEVPQPIIPAPSIIVEQEDSGWQIGFADDAAGPFRSRRLAEAVAAGVCRADF
jgi:hypothetical protein